MSTSIFLYAYSNRLLNKSIESIEDHTPPDVKIIVCQDADFNISNELIVSKTDGVGRARAWNQAVAQDESDTLIFMRAPVKVSEGWMEELLALLDDKSIVSPRIYMLDTALWSSEPNCYHNVSMRWDLEPYAKNGTHSGGKSPLLTSYCIALKRSWFDSLGRFDDGMLPGRGEDIEFTLRNGLMGGSNKITQLSSVACDFEVDASPNTINNKARIAGVWLNRYANRVYDSLNLDATAVKTGKINRLESLKEKCLYSIDWWVKHNIPELDEIYNLRNIANGKRVAIVAPGASIDYINSSTITSNDIIIGIDYAGLLYDCDYVMTDSVLILADLKTRYKSERFILPMELENRVAGSYVRTSDVTDVKYQYEKLPRNAIPSSASPPLCDFDQVTLSAVHLSLFLNPKTTMIFGFENGLTGGRSHTTRSEFYNDGYIYEDTESTKKLYAFNNHCLDHLGKLANNLKIPLIRINHA